MNTSLNTSKTEKAAQELSEKKLGRLLDLLRPVLRKRLKTEQQGQALIEAPLFVDRFDQLVTELVGKLTNTFMVTVDYSHSLPEMIKAGNYGYANDSITAENFPIIEIDKVGGIKRLSGKVDTEIILVHFNRSISSDNAIKEMDELGLRPAALPELLAFGEMHPAVQKEFPIVALGSVWRVGVGYRYVPYLSRWYARRELSLRSFDGDWFGHYSFAAVRK